jgi:HEAT repeat protein
VASALGFKSEVVHAAESNGVPSNASGPLPELVDEVQWIIDDKLPSSFVLPPRMLGVWNANRTDLELISTQDSPSTRRELQHRIKDAARPITTRLLYAGILASWGDASGQQFLLEQARKASSFAEVEDSLWLIGHLDRLHAHTANTSQLVDMHWAEDFMLDALRDRRQLTGIFGAATRTSTVRELASPSFDEGGFMEHLVRMKSSQLYPVLVALFNERAGEPNYLSFVFGELGDTRAIPLLLEALQTTKDSSYFGNLAIVLAKLGSKEAIPILLSHLDKYETYSALSQYSDERILPALTQALPNLHNHARGAARTLIIKLEGGDLLPKLIALAEDPNHQGMETLSLIAELKDKRAVPFATKILNSSPDLASGVHALWILGGITNSPEAIKSLIDALDMNFPVLFNGIEVRVNDNEWCHKEIAEYLAKLTGQNLGNDKKRWQEWFAKNYPQFSSTAKPKSNSGK